MQLRKDRRDENLQKKRMVSAVAPEGGELESNRAGQVQQKVRRRRPPPLGRPRQVRCADSAPPGPRAAHERPPPGANWVPPTRPRCRSSSRCRPWSRACGLRTRRRSSRPPHSSASCSPLVGVPSWAQGVCALVCGVAVRRLHQCRRGGRAAARRAPPPRSVAQPPPPNRTGVPCLAPSPAQPCPSPPPPACPRRAQPSDRGGDCAERDPSLCAVPAARRPAAAAV